MKGPALLAAALAVPLGLAQTGRPEDPEPAPVPLAAGGERVPEWALGAGVVETMDTVLERAQQRPAREPVIHRMHHDEHGRWEIPSPRHAEYPHSGERYLTVEWGDTRMGLSFGGFVEPRGVWVSGHKSPAVWAPALRAVGYANGEEVARTDWFETIGATPAWFALELGRVDRIEFVARPAFEGAAYYGLDDLTFERPAEGNEAVQPVVLDFEDCAYRQVLTGSDYGGLTWESGSGDFAQEPRDVHAPKTPPGSKSKSAAPPVPLTRAADAGTSPELVETFEGPDLLDPGAFFIPPDTCGSVGPNHFVSVVNDHISIYDKATKQRLVSTDLESFLNISETAGDPRVAYDPSDDRWVITATDFSTEVHLAYSTSNDPTGAWFKTSIVVVMGSDLGTFPDFPTMGVDHEGIYFAAYMVGNNDTMSLFAVDKAPLLASTPALGTVTAWRQLPYEGSIQPCVTWDAAPGEYLVSLVDPTTQRIRRVDPPLDAPSLVEVGMVTTIAGNPPPLASALGSVVDLFTVDNRLWNAVYQEGSLWTTHTVDVGGRAAVNWYELDPATPSVIQQGTVADPVRHYFFPSIAANSEGDVLLGFSGSSPTEFAGCWAAGRTRLDPPGQMSPPAEYQPGLGTYNLVGNGLCRWGDYSMTSVDPTDESLWTIQEYAGAPMDTWSTRVAHFEFSCGDVVSYCTAGTSSSGCQASLSASGTPSASAASGFVVTATAVEGAEDGVFFFGTNGRQANPWGSGSSVQCVVPPVKRGGRLVGTGTAGSCDGGFAEDLNARWATHLAQNPGPGATVQVQLWYRDLQSSTNQKTALSDALEFALCP